MITRTITTHRTEILTTGEPIVIEEKLSLREIKKTL